jgi:hypothetical protein
VDIIHPDPLTTGGILETHKIGHMAQEYGVPMALHCAHTPIGAIASANVAAATENFLILENHAVDTPYWGDLVDGIDKPIVNKGYITVPDKPGLGITLNEAACKQHLAEPGWVRTDRPVEQYRPTERPPLELDSDEEIRDVAFSWATAGRRPRWTGSGGW